MRNRLLLFFGLPLMVLLAGCASPGQRIKKNPALFNSFPAEVKAKVEKGEVDIGFTPDMVFIALGHPDRKYQRTTETGTVEVWAYVDYRYNYEQQLVRGSFRYRDAQGHLRSTNDNIWVDVKTKTEFDRIRVELADDKVVAIDRLEK